MAHSRHDIAVGVRNGVRQRWASWSIGRPPWCEVAPSSAPRTDPRGTNLTGQYDQRIPLSEGDDQATADAAGRCTVSPRGGPPGFVRVLDDHKVRAAFVSAIQAAAVRSRELSGG